MVRIHPDQVLVVGLFLRNRRDRPSPIEDLVDHFDLNLRQHTDVSLKVAFAFFYYYITIILSGGTILLRLVSRRNLLQKPIPLGNASPSESKRPTPRLRAFHREHTETPPAVFRSSV